MVDAFIEDSSHDGGEEMSERVSMALVPWSPVQRQDEAMPGWKLGDSEGELIKGHRPVFEPMGNHAAVENL